MFIQTNEIHDNEIVAIKKDAIILRLGRRSDSRIPGEIGEHLVFRSKGEYESYIYIRPLEIYYSSANGLDIKGMDMDVYNENHKEFFGSFIADVFRAAEISPKKDEVLKKIRSFYDSYRMKTLDINYYREFTAASKFRDKDGLEYDNIFYDKEMSQVDIGYNAKFISKMMLVFMNTDFGI